MGYWIARPYWGLGFATEAGRQLLHIARAMSLPKLSAGHFVDNPASGAVLRKLGFRPTGKVAQRYSLARRFRCRRHPDAKPHRGRGFRSEEHTSELQSLMRISYAGFGLKKKKHINK